MDLWCTVVGRWRKERGSKAELSWRVGGNASGSRRKSVYTYRGNGCGGKWRNEKCKFVCAGAFGRAGTVFGAARPAVRWTLYLKGRRSSDHGKAGEVVGTFGRGYDLSDEKWNGKAAGESRGDYGKLYVSLCLFGKSRLPADVWRRAGVQPATA